MGRGLAEPMESQSTSRLCSTRVPVPASGRRSYARSPSARAATTSARSSTKSAISLSSPSNPSKQNRWRGAWLVGLAISAALLVWVLYRIDPRKVWDYAQHANVWLLLLAVVVATVTFPVRAIRWRLILRDGDGRPFPFLPLWHATTIGFMANNLLPARAGEVARAYVASRQLPVRFTTALGSIVVERVFDALVMLGLMAVAIAAPSFPARALVGGRSLSTIAATTAVLFGVLLLIALYNVDSSLAVSYALTYHLTTFLPITLLGLWSLSRLHLKLREVSRPAGGNAA